LNASYDAAFEVADALTERKEVGQDAFQHAAWAADLASHPQWIGGGVALEAAEAAGTENENVAQANFVRCLVGNPFNVITFDPFWLSPAVVGLASSIYEHQVFTRMPDLAVVLKARGCDNADILEHCRQNENHVRGCWVVDAILGKQ
jgi:hypothetical protein